MVVLNARVKIKIHLIVYVVVAIDLAICFKVGNRVAITDVIICSCVWSYVGACVCGVAASARAQIPVQRND